MLLAKSVLKCFYVDANVSGDVRHKQNQNRVGDGKLETATVLLSRNVRKLVSRIDILVVRRKKCNQLINISLE